MAFEMKPGEGQFILNPTDARAGVECDADKYDCSDFATQLDAKQCFDSCWVCRGLTFTGCMRTGTR